MAGLVPAIHVCHARESGHPIVLGVNSLWIAEPHPRHTGESGIQGHNLSTPFDIPRLIYF
jgi:hypothetical protein